MEGREGRGSAGACRRAGAYGGVVQACSDFFGAVIIFAASQLVSINVIQLSPTPLLYNATRAFNSYKSHAAITGNGTSQAMLAFFYATGFQGVVNVDQAKALLYYTYGAHGGSQSAQMALAYRYWAGIGVNDDCSSALEWYQSAAEHCAIAFAVVRECVLMDLFGSDGKIPVGPAWWPDVVADSDAPVRPGRRSVRSRSERGFDGLERTSGSY